jgi:hypothetical protein
MRYLIAFALVIIAVVASAPTASAEQGCPAASLTFQQADMAGVYINAESPMRVEIFPCGGSTVLWDNAFGRHQAVYTSVDRLTGGGIIAHGFRPDPSVGYLDDCYTLAFKPGVPGTIEVYTVSPYGQFIGMYILRKV